MTRAIAIAGNPNSGKSTLFQALTGKRVRIGNYPGITVEERRADLRGHPELELVDIPGTYSLVARTGEEQIAIERILGLGSAPPAAVVVCVETSQALRGLYFAMQLQEFGVPIVVALTLADEAAHVPDTRAIAAALGCEVIAVAAREGRGLDTLTRAMVRVAGEPPPEPKWRWQPSPALAAMIDDVVPHLPTSLASARDARAMALWALQSVDNDHDADADRLRHVSPPLLAAVTSHAAHGPAIDGEVAQARWAWLDANLAPLFVAPPTRVQTRADRIDAVLLNRFAGMAVFIAIMFVVFMSLFAWADPAIATIEGGQAMLGDAVRAAMGQGLAADFVVDAVIGGVGSVLVFLPQILLLFLFLGVLEDSGYLARVAYLMDRVMRTMNLHGKAFVPMLSGFACAVPAIMATRTMERQRDRILTMAVIPLMTCSARLPVYSLIIGALFVGQKFTQSLLMVAMYLFSIVMSLLAAFVLSRTVKPLRAKRLPFIIELPPYRMPGLRDVLRQMWERSRMFLTEAGTVIFACTIGLWVLLTFPRSDVPPSLEAPPASVMPVNLDPAAYAQSYQLRHSYAGRLGHFIEPAIEPLGFDWKIGVGLLGAFAAREVFVSTMGVVYSVGGEVDEHSTSLRDAMHAERREDGSKLFTPLVGISLMVFFALAMQCISTLAVLKRETQGYRWPMFVLLYMTGMAWLASFAVYQGGRLLGFS
ncbi:MAG: ferrous iron transport protein B [Myxococcales bacterium]|nr:ferrous iron transport protein B [Myxococcales bacterium]